MKRLHLTTVLAIAGIALAAPAAKAVNTYTDNGELLLGFRQAGATNDYLLKVTLASSLPLIGGTAFSLGTIATDLQSAFGANWYTATGSSQVYWAVFGDNTNNSANGILYTGRSTSTPWPTFNVGATSTALSNVQQVTSDYNTSTSSSAPTGWLESASDPFSYASYQPGGSNASGISFQAWSPTTESAVTQRMYLDVMPLNSSGATTATQVPGFFNLLVSGTGANQTFVTYTAPVPEPSTYASLALGAALVAMVLRRHALKAKAQNSARLTFSCAAHGQRN